MPVPVKVWLKRTLHNAVAVLYDAIQTVQLLFLLQADVIVGLRRTRIPYLRLDTSLRRTNHVLQWSNAHRAASAKECAYPYLRAVAQLEGRLWAGSQVGVGWRLIPAVE